MKNLPDQLLGLTERLAAIEQREKDRDNQNKDLADKISEQSRHQQQTLYRMDTAERRLDKVEGKQEVHGSKINQQSNRQDLLSQEITGMKGALSEIKEDTQYTRRQSDQQSKQAKTQTISFILSIVLIVVTVVINAIL